MNPDQQNPLEPTAQPVNPAPNHAQRVIQPLPSSSVAPVAPAAPLTPASPVVADEPTTHTTPAVIQAALQETSFAPTPAIAVVSSSQDAAFSDNSDPSNTPEDFEYISNPFLNSIRGLVLILENNPVSSLLAGLFGLVLYVITFVLIPVLGILTGSPAVALTGSLVLVIVFGISLGTYYVIAGASARKETISTRDAYARSVKRFIPLVGLFILTFIAIALSSLLLIIPGIIVAARLSLAPLILFEEEVGPINAIKRSFSLTKGHVNEMLGAIFAGMFLGGTYSLLFGSTSVSPLIGRYHDLLKLKDAGTEKPKIHWLNYCYLIAIVIIAGFIGLAAAGIHAESKSFKSTDNSSTSFPPSDATNDDSFNTDFSSN